MMKFEDIVSELRKAVAQYPDNIAIIEDAVSTLTYKEMWQHASRIAAGLCSVQSASSYVIVDLPKSIRYIVSVLGCWIAGKAFVPLGPDLPESRKEYIKNQVDTDIHITADSYQSFLANKGCERPVTLLPDTPAYLIFSSGTTGLPKGIVVGHSGLTNLARCQREAFGINSQSRNLFFLSINFDASISDILVTLTSGATLVIEPTDSISLSANIMDIIDKQRITHADLPPSLIRIMDADKCPDSLQTIVIGGEATDRDTVAKWATKVRLINVYGPTETTVCTSLCQYTQAWDVPTIGKEIKDVKYDIYNNGLLDADEGELWISGPCLAIGYYKNPYLTEKKFPVVDGVRYYRTADHVCKLPNEDIAFLGRFDRQVKFHGQLVELEEVEANLKALSFIRNVAVVKRQVSVFNAKEMLVAFVEIDHSLSKEDCIRIIQKSLRHHLPIWMIPGHIEFLDIFPKLTSGKIDLKTLESIELSNLNIKDDEPYSSEKEEAIASLMAEILKLPRIGSHDDFIKLGADSLDLLVFIIRLSNEQGIAVTHDQLRQNATPFAISHIETGGAMARCSDDLRDKWQLSVNPSFSLKKEPKGMILITGSTGFLGSHILAELLLRKEYAGRDVVCLVRCDTPSHGKKRLMASFRKYGLHCDAFDRIIVVSSDLSDDNLGLDSEMYTFLAENVTEVFHCAAAVNMMADFDTLNAANVIATKHIIEFCVSGCKKKLNYASTLSVFVSTTRNIGVALENDELNDSCTIFGGYGQTKYVCEKMLMGLHHSACHINIIRYGLLCGDTDKGISADKDFLGMFLRGAATVGALPWDRSNEIGIDITPIDMATKITLDITSRSESGHYHIAAENPLKYNHLCVILQDTIGLKVIRDFDQWQLNAQSHKHSPDVNAMIMSLCRLDPDSYETMRYMDLFQTTNIRFDMQNTHRVTNHRIYQNDQLIKKYISHEKI